MGLSVRMGVDGVPGQAAVDWVSELKSSTSLDGSVQLEEGRDVRIMLNTPEDVMDIFSLRFLTLLQLGSKFTMSNVHQHNTSCGVPFCVY